MNEQIKSKQSSTFRTEARRLESVQKCVAEFNARAGKDWGAEVRRVCQPARIWQVSAQRRAVVPGSDWLTFVNSVSSREISFFALRPLACSHAVIELFGNQNALQVRLLVRLDETKPAIRGFYLTQATILTTVPSDPQSVVFNHGYFPET